MSRVVVPHVLTTVGLAVGTSVALVAYGALSGAGPFWFVPLRPELFDPDDMGDRGLTYFVTLPCMAAVMLGVWTPWARVLKVLPVSAKQINALLLITPFATWTILWVLGYVAYLIAYGMPQTLRIEFAFGMAAMSALVHAAMLRFQGGAGTFLVMIGLGGLLGPLVKIGLRDELSYQIAFAVITTIALGSAIFINHRTLTRSTSSSRPYRPPAPPFGVSPTARIG